MGDPRRFNEFAKLIQRNFPTIKKIADVAGGKGYLQTALRELGYEAITFDKRKGRRDRPKMRYQYRYFNESVLEEFDLLVGMHPDEATDIIIDEAAKRKIPFAIVPCCAISTVSSYWGSKGGFHEWVAHLHRFAKSKGFNTKEIQLKINGRNLVIIGNPR